jgi:4-oxalocrotonate tautomerase
MPLVQISIVEGRTPQQLRTLLAEVHEAVVRSIDAAPSSVRVLITEVPPTLWLSGGTTLSEKAAGTSVDS